MDFLECGKLQHRQSFSEVNPKSCHNVVNILCFVSISSTIFCVFYTFTMFLYKPHFPEDMCSLNNEMVYTYMLCVIICLLCQVIILCVLKILVLKILS